MTQFLNTLAKIIIPLKGISFSLLLLVMLGLELFVIKPIGAILSTVVLVYWLVNNKQRLRTWGQKLHNSLNTWYREYPARSIWFDNGGRDKIVAAIVLLNGKGETFCELNKQIELPPYEHWPAISKGLDKLGVQSQYTVGAFYTKWTQKTVATWETHQS